MDTKSIQLPASIISVDCLTCEKESILDYDFNDKSLKCSKCPERTYSTGGTFVVNGLMKNWNDSNQNFQKLTGSCFIQVNDAENLEGNCKGWRIAADNSYIYAGTTTLKDFTYYAELFMGVNLVRKGKVKLIYSI